MLFDYNEIIQGQLWVGRFIDHKDAKQLWRLGVTTVINLQSDHDIKSCRINLKKLEKALDAVDIELLRLPVPDFNEDLLAHQLPHLVDKLEAVLALNWTKVYLHCTAGVNRSPTVAAAYLMKVFGRPAKESYDYLVSRRDCMPYLNVLHKYESLLRLTSPTKKKTEVEINVAGCWVTVG